MSAEISILLLDALGVRGNLSLHRPNVNNDNVNNIYPGPDRNLRALTPHLQRVAP